MKYLKKYKLFLEEDEFETKDTDKEDVKLSKKKLDLLRSQLAEYPSKKIGIDNIYKKYKTIKETESEIENILGSNPFLVDYNNISRISKEVDIIHNEIVLDKIKADEFKEEASLVKDSETKAIISSKLADIQNRISDKNKELEDKKKDVIDLSKELDEKMVKMRTDMEEHIKKISEPEEK
jgi:hypothetical protein